MNDVFISYASSDRQIAQKFADAFENCGWSVWWDREIPVGKNFDQVIEEELNTARCVVVLWSKESVQSRWVKTESSAAADRDRLAPVLIDEAAIPLEFKRIQTAMLAHWDGDTANPEFQRLVHAVGNLVGRPEPVGRAAPHKTQNRSKPAGAPWVSPRLLSAVAVLLILGGLVLAKKVFRTAPQETTSPSSNSTAQNSNPSSTVSPSGDSAPSQNTSDNRKSAPSKATFPVKIGDKIGDNVPAPGA